MDLDIPDDDNGSGCKWDSNTVDLLNDCLDQIYDYFQDEIEFDEDTVVEFLRSNGYDIQEAIDYIMEFGPRKKPTPPPAIPSYTPVTTSKYTVPTSEFSRVFEVMIRYSCFCNRKESTSSLSSLHPPSK